MQQEELTKDAAPWLASLVGLEVRHVLTKNGVDGQIAFSAGASAQESAEAVLAAMLPNPRKN